MIGSPYLASQLPPFQLKGGNPWLLRYFVLWMALGATSIVLQKTPMADASVFFRGISAAAGLGFWLTLFNASFYDWLRGRSRYQDQRLLLTQLGDLLLVGIPLPEALEWLHRHSSRDWRSRHSLTAKALLYLSHSTARGTSLAKAMAETRVFPYHWCLLVEAAEPRGLLPEILTRLDAGRAQQPWFDYWTLTKLWLTSTLGLGLCFFLATYIMPTFVAMFENAGWQLPLATRLLLSGVRGLRDPSFPVLRLVVFGVALLAASASAFSPVLAARFAGWIARIPPWSAVLPLEEQANQCHMLSLALRLGLTLPEAASVAAAASRLQGYRDALQPDGGLHSLSQLLDRHPQLYARPLRWLVREGERLDNLGPALEAAAEHLSDLAQERKLRAAVWLEFWGTNALGLGVVVLALAVMQPVLMCNISLLGDWLVP